MADPAARSTLVRNALANVASGAAGALLAVVVPPFLARWLDQSSYSVWALLLQVGGYVGIFGIGLQTATGRFVAKTEAMKDQVEQDRVVSSATTLLAGSGLVAFGLAVITSVLFPYLFPEIPAHLKNDARIVFLLVASSLALGLPFSALAGVFAGLQRNEIPAMLSLSSRLFLAIGIILAARISRSLVVMAGVYACINCIWYLSVVVAVKNYVPRLRVMLGSVDQAAVRQLLGFCGSLVIWSLAMLLVNGLDLVLVGKFDFRSVGAFAIAAGLLALLQGGFSAIANVLIPAGAALDATGGRDRIQGLLLCTTRWTILLVGVLQCLWLLGGEYVVKVYLGQAYASSVITVFSVLLLASAVRLSMLPYTVLALGVGDHRRVIWGPVAEGVTNLVASVLLGKLYGAIGVAWGTVIGGGVGIIFHLGWNLPRSSKIGIGIGTFIWQSYLPAAIALAPLLSLQVVLLMNPGFGIRFGGSCKCLAIGVFVMVGWLVGLVSSERKSICRVVFLGRWEKCAD